MSKSGHFTGYAPADYATRYARYYNETVAPLAASVAAAIGRSPLPAGTLPAFADARNLEDATYTAAENGYTLEPDGAAHVAVLTPMPGVTPGMWAWWFGWHGCRDDRYKLWHPKAHLGARWEDGADDVAYIGRTSLIEEFIGAERLTAAIQFKPPTAFGFSYETLKDPTDAVYICARIGYPVSPLDFGYLVHQLQSVAGGCEMRSRFWMGGRYIHLRRDGVVADAISDVLRRMKTISEEFARSLLQHCSEEMTHLAAFLPSLYADAGHDTSA